MILHSLRFGDLEITEDHVFHFTEGIPGFPDDKAFAYLPFGEKDKSPFAYLQSLDTPELTFLVADPFSFFSDYMVPLTDDFAAELEFSNDNPPQIYTTVTIPEKLENMTTNLLAPILLNWQTKTGRQVILEKTPYTTRHRLFPHGFDKENVGSEVSHASIKS